MNELLPQLQAARRICALGAILLALGIISGAFGAHALKEVLDEHTRVIYEKAVFYHVVDAVGIFALGALCASGALGAKASRAVAAVLTGGIAIFSGSLYLYSTTRSVFWAMITPIGGSLLILGWVAAGIALLRDASRRS